jgi:hypothetical protein
MFQNLVFSKEKQIAEIKYGFFPVDSNVTSFFAKLCTAK